VERPLWDLGDGMYDWSALDASHTLTPVESRAYCRYLSAGYEARDSRLPFTERVASQVRIRRAQRASKKSEMEDSTLDMAGLLLTCQPPVRVRRSKTSGRIILWFPEETRTVYTYRVACANPECEVARGSLTYYRKSRREPGRMKFDWSLIDDGINGIERYINE
jgi:hypothetical protein